MAAEDMLLTCALAEHIVIHAQETQLPIRVVEKANKNKLTIRLTTYINLQLVSRVRGFDIYSGLALGEASFKGR